MPKYLILYRSRMEPGEQMDSSTPEEMQAEMQKWMAWGESAGAALVDFGEPTKPTSSDDPGPAGWVGGYSILQADDEAGLQALLTGHPHKEFGTIEVHEILPMPGQ